VTGPSGHTSVRSRLSPSGPDPGLCGHQIRGPVQQRLAPQPPGDAAGFHKSRRGGLVITPVQQVLGVVEQAVGELVRRAQLA